MQTKAKVVGGLLRQTNSRQSLDQELRWRHARVGASFQPTIASLLPHVAAALQYQGCVRNHAQRVAMPGVVYAANGPRTSALVRAGLSGVHCFRTTDAGSACPDFAFCGAISGLLVQLLPGAPTSCRSPLQ